MKAVRERIRLKSHRLAAELHRQRRSQNAWAQRLGLSKGYLSQLVNGRRRYPSAAVRQRLLDTLGLSFDDLFERERSPAPDRSTEESGSIGRREPRGWEPRSSRGDGSMAHFLSDLRLGWRQLIRRPTFTALAVTVLALGIGANATIFSIVDGVLLSPLDYPDSDRLVLLDENHLERGLNRFGVSPGNLADWRTPKETLSDVAGYLPRAANLRAGDRPLRVGYAIVTANLFELLGVEPARGRGFSADEETPGADDVVVLSHSFRSRHFGDLEAIGETLELDGIPHTVVGVMPPGFEFPQATTELWKPMALPALEADNRSGRWLAAIGRLRSTSDLEAARTEMNALAQRLGTAHPESNGGWRVTVTPLRASLVAGARSPLMMLWATTGLVLLIACANVAHLLSIRTDERRQELSIRAALGAGRGRLVVQLLAENTLLATLAGVFGLALAELGVRLVPTLASGALPRADVVDVDARVLVFTLALAWLTGLLFGLMPALRLSDRALSPTLRTAGQRIAGGGRRSLLVVSEVALALMVLIGTGLLARSLGEVLEVDPGFTPEGLLSLRVEPPMNVDLDGVDIEAAIAQIMAQRGQMAERFGELVERVAALPGIDGVAAINRPPLHGDSWFIKFFLADRERPTDSDAPTALGRVVTPGYFRTMGIPLISGRTLTRSDVQGAQRVAVIDRRAADLYWPDEDPIGRRLTMGDVPPQFAEQFTFTVVGIVGGVHHDTLETMARPTVYFPFAQATTGHSGDWGMTLMVRAEGEPMDHVPSIRDEVGQVFSGLPVFAVRSMQEAVSGSVAARRFHLRLLGLFAALGLVLAAVGIYGVTAYTVSRRGKEMGIRSALGARAVDVVGQMTREGMMPVAVGLVCGLIGALAAGRVLDSFVFGVRPTDPLSFATGIAVLATVGLAACLIPARRAARIDPAVVLRDE